MPLTLLSNKNFFALCYFILALSPVQAGCLDAKYKDIHRSIKAASIKVGVPFDVLLALCWHESKFKAESSSKFDVYSISYSICQVKLETANFMDDVYKHKNRATPESLNDININAFYAAKYFKYQLKRYNYDLRMAIDGYNKGKAVNVNSKYVVNVMKAHAEVTKELLFDPDL